MSHDAFDGVGSYQWADGRSYLGEWQAGVMHGLGEFKIDKKSAYIGQFENNVKEGYGVYEWLEKDKVYAGYWK